MRFVFMCAPWDHARTNLAAIIRPSVGLLRLDRPPVMRKLLRPSTVSDYGEETVT